MVQRSWLVIAAATVVCASAPASALAFPWPLIRRHPSPPLAAPLPISPPTDVATDPAIRSGVLADGLRYAILPIADEPVSLRLRIAAGPLTEGADHPGFTAILRRLAFDGVRLPHHADPRAIAAAHGLVFTAEDTAQATGIDATTYRFDGVKRDAAAVGAALTLLRGLAGDLTLSQRDIDRERDQVSAQTRAAGHAQYRIFRARAAFLLGGDAAGDSASFAQADPPPRIKRDRIAAFHAATYRPERAVLVVVGDVDPSLTEDRLRAIFADWRPAGRAIDAVAAAPIGGVRARLLVDPAAPMTIQISWRGSAATAPDTIARRRDDLVEQLAESILDRRLAAMSDGGDAPISGAVVLRDDELGVPITSLLAGSDEAHWRETLTMLDQERRRGVDHGVGVAELADAIARQHATLSTRVDARATSPSEIADGLAADLAAGITPTSAAQDLAFFESNVAAATPQTVSAELRALFAGAGPSIFVTSPEPLDGGERAIAAAYAQARSLPLEARGPSAPTWPYTDFGIPGRVVDRREIADLDAVVVTFANGARLTIKPTKFTPGEVRVSIRVDQAPVAGEDANVAGGGLGRLSSADIARALPGVRFSARSIPQADAYELAGVTDRDDLESEARVLTAFVVDAAWRGQSPSAAARAAFGPAATTPLEAVVVGDVTIEEAIAAFAETLGALPARGAPSPRAAAAVLVAPIGAMPRWRLGGEPAAGRADEVLDRVLANRGSSPTMATRAITAPEVDAARAELLGSLDSFQRTNAWWRAALDGAAGDPHRLDAIRSLRAQYLRLTPASVEATRRTRAAEG